MREAEWREYVTKQAQEKIAKVSQNLQRMRTEKYFKKETGKMGKCLEKKPRFSGWER